MSFDLFLQAFDTGASAPIDRASVLAVLRQHNQDSADRFGFYLVQFADGSHIEFSAKGLESGEDFTGCAFHIRGFSPAALSFIYDVATVGNMVIFNAQGSDTVSDPLVMLTAPSQLAHLPEGAGANPVLCSSAVELARLLGVGFEKWENYRDQVNSTTTTSR